jgi:hypothetical protein
VIYPYLTFPDDTEVVHSGIEMKDGKETVRVYFEKPVETGFFTAECILPQRTWSKVKRFSLDELDNLLVFINNQVDLFYEYARKGGIFNNARSMFTFQKENRKQMQQNYGF